MSNSIAPGSSADVNVRVTALTTNPNVPVTYKTIILKKNLVNGVNTLTQEMMSAQNTKYVIKYNYVLGEDITVLAGCILEFDGGSITNTESTNITGNYTRINTPLTQIFNTNIKLLGSWCVKDFIPQWWGAKGDGINDDSDAIQCAIDSIYKGVEDSTKDSYLHKGCTSVFLPNTNKYYRITKTLDFSEKWNFKFYSETINDSTRSLDKVCTLLWDGATNSNMALLSYIFDSVFENISFHGNDIEGVIGLKLSIEGAENSSVKDCLFKYIYAKHCASGIVVGSQNSDAAPDDAIVTFEFCNLYRNKYWGIQICGSNTACSLINCFVGANGLNTELQESEMGGNVHIKHAEVFINNYVSAGNSSGYPKTADIRQYGGGLRIYGVWSDTPGIFLKGDYCTTSAIVSGVRHYEGSMTIENTPISITWAGPQPLVLEGCYLYNKVVVNEGQAGQVIDLGTRFITAGATVEGPEVSNKPMRLTSLNNGIKVGYTNMPFGIGAEIAEVLRTRHYESHRMATDGTGTITESINSDASIYELAYNGYKDLSCNFKAVKAGPVLQSIIREQDGNVWFGLYHGIASSAGEQVSMTENFAVKINGSYYCIKLGSHYITFSFSNDAPVNGSWSAGDICFNAAPASGRASMWIYDGSNWTVGATCQ